MICLLVSLRFLKQIRSVDPILVNGLLQDIQSCIRGNNGYPVDGFPLFYEFTEKQNGLFMLAQASYRVFEILRNAGDGIAGFSIAIGRYDGRNHAGAYAFFCEAVLKSPVDDCLWIMDPAGIRAFDYFFLEQQGRLFKVTGIKKETLLSSDVVLDFWIRDSVRSRIEEAVEPYVTGKERTIPILLYGERRVGKRENARRALRNLGIDDSSILAIRRPIGAANPLALFLEAIDPLLLAEAEGRADENTIRALRDNENAWRFVRSDPFSTVTSGFVRLSFMKFFNAYLRLFSAVSKSGGNAAAVIFENADEYPEAVLDDVLGSLRLLMSEERFVPIITASGRIPESLALFPHEIIEIGPAEPMELERLVSAVAPGIGPERARAIAEAADGRTFAAFHGALIAAEMGASDIAPPDPKEALESAVLRLGDGCRDMLFRTYLAQCLPNRDLRKAFICGRDPTNEKTIIQLQELFQAGLLGSTKQLDIVFPELWVFAEKAAIPKSSTIRNEFAIFLASRMASRDLLPSFEALVFEESLGYPVSERAKFAVGLEGIRSGKGPPGKGLGESGKKATESGKIARRLLAVYELFADYPAEERATPSGSVGSVLEELKAAEEESGCFRGVIELFRSVDLYSRGDFQAALVSVKSALMLLQNDNFVELYSFANRIIGCVMLAMGHPDVASEYFEIAEQLSEKEGNRYEFLYDIFYAVDSQFIVGNYSKAFRLIEKGRSAALSLVAAGWEALFDFLEGRLRFDTGDYATAISLFTRCVEYGIGKFEDESIAWRARSRAYSGEKDAAAEFGAIPETAERLFFAAEALYLSSDREGALEAIGKAGKHATARRYLSPENPSAGDGFDMLENRAIPFAKSGNALSRLLEAFDDFIFGEHRARERESWTAEQATEARAVSYDPYEHLRLLWRYLTLSADASSNSIDRITVLSRAFRFLQHRSSNNDAAREKNEFIYKNYWNLQLAEAAKANKLI